jgi:hypothetical protein
MPSLTTPLTDAVIDEWIGRCEGFQVIGPEGRIGVVVETDAGAGELAVATGLFDIRQVLVSADDVAAIDPGRKRVFVRTTRTLR